MRELRIFKACCTRCGKVHAPKPVAASRIALHPADLWRVLAETVAGRTQAAAAPEPPPDLAAAIKTSRAETAAQRAERLSGFFRSSPISEAPRPRVSDPAPTAPDLASILRRKGA